MSAIAISPYSDDDFETVTAIWLESSNSMAIAMPVTLHDLRERWPKEMAAGWQVHIARDGVQPVGFLALKGDTIDQLFIAPSWQGRGIGKRLLDLAKARLPDGFSLTTAALGRAESFYQREGLVRGETGRHRFGHEIVRYDWRPENPVS